MKKVLVGMVAVVLVLAFVSCDLINPPSPKISVLAAPDPGDGTVYDMGHGNEIKFGNTPVNVPVEKTITVKNVGDALLTIDSITTETSQTAFTVNGDPIGVTALLPDEEITFVVQLFSAQADNYGAKLLIPNDDPEFDNYYLELVGTVEHVE